VGRISKHRTVGIRLTPRSVGTYTAGVARGRSSMVEPQSSKLTTRVRFSSPAPPKTVTLQGISALCDVPRETSIYPSRPPFRSCLGPVVPRPVGSGDRRHEIPVPSPQAHPADRHRHRRSPHSRVLGVCRESTEPPCLRTGRGTIPLREPEVPDVRDEGNGLCDGFGRGQSRWWSLGVASEPGLGTARSVSHRRWLSSMGARASGVSRTAGATRRQTRALEDERQLVRRARVRDSPPAVISCHRSR
jgi:hypothetical protein